MIIPESSVTELRSMALVAQIEGGLSSVVRPEKARSFIMSQGDMSEISHMTVTRREITEVSMKSGSGSTLIDNAMLKRRIH